MKNMWNEKMTVGVRQFDEHHKTIIDMIHQLSQGLEGDISREEIRAILSALSSYIRYHFIAEERFMDTYNYDEKDIHIAEHRFFRERINRFLDRFTEGQKNIDREILDFLKEWFVKHIMGTDKRYGLYLNKRGVH